MSTFLRKSFAITLGVTSLVMLSGFVSVSPAKAASAGDLVKVAGSSAVYYIGADSKRYVFPNSDTYYSWYADFSTVKTVSSSELLGYQIGGNVTLRGGTYMLKLTNDPKVYVVEPGGKLRHIASEAQAAAMFGSDWAKRVRDISDAFLTPPTYSFGEAISSGFSSGMLVKVGSSLYYVDGTSKRLVSDVGKSGNMFRDQFAVTASDLSGYSDGSAISGMESALSTLAGSGAVPVIPTGSGLTAALASDTPAATSIIADNTTGDGAQALVEFAKVNFTAASDGAVKVKTLKFSRTGVSADSDISNAYLYDGSTRIAEYSSFSAGVLTFNSSSGLFTASAGSSKVITLKADVVNGATSGKTIGFKVAAASDVVTDGAAVNGTFPLTGNNMSTARVDDIGKVTLANVSPSGASTVDAGQTGYEVWRFSVASSDQKIEMSKFRFTMVGTISTSDLANLKLYDGATQLGATAASMDSDNTVTFDLGSSPLVLTSGVTKNLSLKADIVSGTSRTYRFSFQKQSDIVAKDAGYGVYIKPNQTDSFAIVQAGGATTINSGTLTVSVSSSSPTGSVALDATDVEFARFDFKATGEDVKINSLPVQVDTNVASAGLNNAKLYVDGSQVGSTADLTEDTDVSFSFGNTFTVPAGQTKTLVVKGEVKKAAGTSFAADNTILVKLSAGASNAQGKTSLTAISSGAVNGNSLTVKTGTLTKAANLSMAAGNITNPTAVIGASAVRIGSFVITGGSGEATEVSQITVADGGTSQVACTGTITTTASPYLGCFAQNLKLMHGSTQIGTTQASLSATAANSITFNPSPAFTIAASEQYVVDVYADILSSTVANVQNGTSPQFIGVDLGTVSATGKSTSSSASVTGSTSGQLISISGSGSLTVAIDASSPVTGQIVMGTVDATVGIFKLSAGSAEDVDITKIVVMDTSSYGGSVSNVKLYNGSTQVGSTVAALDAASNGKAYFDLSLTPLRVVRGSNLLLTVKATVMAYANAVSGSTHVFSLVTGAATDGTEMLARGGQSNGAIAEGDTDPAATQQDAYRTKATVSAATSTPSGSSSENAAQDIFEFNVTGATNAENLDATLNAVAITISGSSLLTGSGSANLYKSTDLSTALATETYATITADAAGSGTGTGATLVDATSPSVNGVPVGATVRIWNASGTPAYFTGTMVVTSITAAGTVTFTPSTTLSEATASGDILYYRPLQPGAGKLYFGTMSNLGADVANGATSVTVVSTNGFALGDTVTVVGFVNATGAGIASTAGGLISSIDNATTLTVGALTLAATIDFNYSSATVKDSAYPVQTGVAYTGLLNTSGQPITAGQTVTFVVKGDTTGANSTTGTDTISAQIGAAADINWDDSLMFSITSRTQTMPVNGGTLQY